MVFHTLFLEVVKTSGKSKLKAYSGAALLFVLIVAGMALFYSQQSAIPFGWLFYDDFTVPDAGLLRATSPDAKWLILNSNTAVVYTGSGIIALRKINYFGVQPSIRSTVDMQGYSIEAKMTGSPVGCNPNVQYACLEPADLSMSVNGGGGSVHGDSRADANGNLQPVIETSVVRIVADPASNAYEVSKNGVFTGDTESVGASYLTFTGQGEVDYVIFKLPFSCKVKLGEVLMYEIIPSGRTLSITSFQHQVSRFCYEHPIVILQEGVGSDTSVTPYDLMASGKTVIVPSGQDWGVFYVAPNDGTFPACDASQILDVGSNKCKSLTGLGISCSSGLFDTVTGDCIVGNIVLCPDGSRYTINQDGSKSCDYLLPTHFICEDPDAVAYPALGKCIVTGQLQIDCQEPGTWNPVTRYCEYFPLKIIRCDDILAAYNSQIDRCEKILKTNITNDCVGGTFIPPDTCKIITTVSEQVVKIITYNETLITTPDIAGCLQKGGSPVDQQGKIVCKVPLASEIVEGEIELHCDRGTPNPETGKCVLRGDEIGGFSILTGALILIGVLIMGGLVIATMILIKKK